MPTRKQGCVGCFLFFVMFIGGCSDNSRIADDSVPTEKPPEVATVPPVATEAMIVPATSEPEAQAPISTTNTAETDPALKNYIREKLAELDKFKSTPEFVQFGFGIGGPYNKWLKEVEFAAHDPQLKRFGLEDRIAVGDLLGLGMEYVSSKGKETKYTTFTRQAILKTLQ